MGEFDFLGSFSEKIIKAYRSTANDTGLMKIFSMMFISMSEIEYCAVVSQRVIIQHMSSEAYAT